MPMVLIADLVARGVRLEASEALAITQQVITQLTGELDLDSEPDAPLLGPPTPANVFLGRDGSAVCLGCQATPAVFEVAVFLQTLLPAGTGQVGGGLRYTIARGLHDVDAPPFDSISDFSRALARYEKGDRAALVRGVFARATGEAPVHTFGRPRAASMPAVDRRKTAPAAATLRRELHAADRRLFEQRALASQDAGRVELPAPARAILIRESRPGRWRLPAVAAVLVGGIALIGVADLMYQRRSPVAGPSTAIADGRLSRDSGVAAVARAPRVVDPSPLKEAKREGRVDVPEVLRHERPARERDANARDEVRYTKAASLPASADQDGSLVRALDDQHRPVFSPAFASSGTAMFFHTGGTQAAHSALAVASSPEGGGDLGVMTIVDDGARNYHVQPSPDGRLIAFDSDRDGERGVYIARRDGTNVQRISGAGYAAVPTWAPDGRRIAYVRAEAGNPKVWNLWLQGVDEGQARRLTSYRYGQPWSASWFPDNRRVAYTHEDELVVLDVETGLDQKFGSPIKGRLVRTPAVSPDGTKVIFQVFRHGAWILNLADQSMQCVLTDPTAEEFAWSPDGRRVAFHSRRDGQWNIYILHRS
jgi:hypothetical protein